jgi:predicted PurR-regulated permease PerM
MPVDVRNIALTIMAVATVIGLLQYLQPILIPFVLGALLFYALDPAVDWMQKKRVPRAIGAGLMLLAVVVGLTALAWALQDQALRVVDQLPTGARKLTALVQRRGAEPGPLDKVQQAAEQLQKSTTATEPGVQRVQVEQPAIQPAQFVWASSLNALGALNQLVMILFLTYFMLLSDELFKRKLVSIVGPTLTKKKITVQILEDIARQVELFLMIQIATSAAVALMTWGALWALGLQQAALWGLMAGVLNSIPYYGPLLVTGGLSIVGFLQFGTIGRTAAVAGAALLITTLEGFLLTPRWMGHVAQMNTVAVFAGLLFWSWLWGVWGMLLAVPMMMVIKAVCDRVEHLEAIGQLLGE